MFREARSLHDTERPDDCPCYSPSLRRNFQVTPLVLATHNALSVGRWPLFGSLNVTEISGRSVELTTQ